MRIASIVSAAALMAMATAGSALAAEPFATLDGVPAETLSPTELAQVQGSHITIIVEDPEGTFNEVASVGKEGKSRDGSVVFNFDGSITIVKDGHL